MRSTLAALAVTSTVLASCGDPAATAPSASASVKAAPTSPPSSAPPEVADFGCGGMTCREFDTPEAAFAAVLEDKPLILAVGETHAQKGSERIESVTSRFTKTMLPTLKGKASALMLELWVADGSCGAKKEQDVAKQQHDVTKTQASSDQNEFVKLGNTSKDLGIIPFILQPKCDDYDRIQKAGEDGVIEMLTMITRMMKEKTTRIFEENKKKSPDQMVLTYGGAMHNDRTPAKGREDWSFAKDLDDVSGHRYVELDLIVPEFVGDSPSWKTMPWYDAFTKAATCKGETSARTKTVLYTMGPRSYALVFPCSGASGGMAPAP